VFAESRCDTEGVRLILFNLHSSTGYKKCKSFLFNMRLIVCILLMFIGCTSQDGKSNASASDIVLSKTQNTTDKANTTEAKSQASTKQSCDRLLKRLIVSSDFDTTGLLSDCIVSVDSYEHKVYLLKVSVYNSKLKNESAIGWIELDVESNQLRDVTIDPESPRRLQFDTVLFNKLVLLCLKKK
jgi:hypothetical protein